MACRAFFCSILFILFNAGLIHALNPPQYCFYGCNSDLYQISFKGGADACTNELFYKFNFYCAAVYCTDAEVDAGVSLFNSSCRYALPSFDSIVSSVDLEGFGQISYEETPATFDKPLNYVVIPDRAFWEIGRRTTVRLQVLYLCTYLLTSL